MIHVENAYHLSEKKKMPRFLVDRIWPHGVHRRVLDLDGWVRAAAPSDELRLWFRHEPARFDQFRTRYRRELERRPESWAVLAEAARRGGVVLVYGTMHPRFSNAQILKEFLEERLKKGAGAHARHTHLVKMSSWPNSPSPSKSASRKGARRRVTGRTVSESGRLRFVSNQFR